MSGIRSPTVLVREVRRLLATSLGRNPISATTARMRSLVSVATGRFPLSEWLTVVGLTPARRATSLIDSRRSLVAKSVLPIDLRHARLTDGAGRAKPFAE